MGSRNGGIVNWSMRKLGTPSGAGAAFAIVRVGLVLVGTPLGARGGCWPPVARCPPEPVDAPPPFAAPPPAARAPRERGAAPPPSPAPPAAPWPPDPPGAVPDPPPPPV